MHRGSPPAPSLWTLLFCFFLRILDFDLLCETIPSMVKLLLLSVYTHWVFLWHETYVWEPREGFYFLLTHCKGCSGWDFACIATRLAAHDDVLVRCNTHSNLQVDLIFLHWQITPVHELRNAEKSQLANNSTLVNGVGLFWTVKSSLPLTHNS